MTKFLKICIVFFIIFFFCLSYVYSIDMNLTENDVVNITTNSDNSLENNSSGSSYSTISTYDSNELSLENILCILLIVVGFLLILLGIAIFIRIKK